MLQGSFIPKFGLIASVDLDLLFVLFNVRGGGAFFAEFGKKAKIRQKIDQFFANFFLKIFKSMNTI